MDAATDFVQEKRNEMIEELKESDIESIRIENEIADTKEYMVDNQKEINKYQYNLNQRTEQVDEVNKVLSQYGNILEKGKNRNCKICINLDKFI
jgi:soluble cytochrome b562